MPNKFKKGDTIIVKATDCGLKHVCGMNNHKGCVGCIGKIIKVGISKNEISADRFKKYTGVVYKVKYEVRAIFGDKIYRNCHTKEAHIRKATQKDVERFHLYRFANA